MNHCPLRNERYSVNYTHRILYLFGADFAFELLNTSLKGDDLLVDGGLLTLESRELLLEADVLALLEGGLDHELLFHASDIGGEVSADVSELNGETVTAARVGVLDAGNDGLLAGKFVILGLERGGEVLDHAADAGSVLRLIHDEKGVSWRIQNKTSS